MESKGYYKYISYIRLFFCLSVLLYHLNILKGGYLAVCSFFVLSGYLSSVNNLKKEKFSLKSYYYNKFIKVYLPLLVLVFITIDFYSFYSNVKWLNLKQETISILFNYNNFWQIQANLDYFAGDISSPFTHLWYISILLQFDLVFPLLFTILKKIGQKISKNISIILIIIMMVISTTYFYMLSLSGNMMMSYYNTFARIFSILFGVFLGFFHVYYGKTIKNTSRKINIENMIIFLSYLILLMICYIFISADSGYYGLGIIFVTLLTSRLIDYSVVSVKNGNLLLGDKIIKYLSELSYEIYLVQYPIIFFMQKLMINKYFKLLIIIVLIFVFSILLDYTLDIKRKNRNKFLLCFFRFVIFVLVILGIYQFSISKDYKKEMDILQKQLNENEELMQKKQEEFNSNFKSETDEWLLEIEDLKGEEQELNNYVSNLPIVGVGDSIMLGAVSNLYNQFKNGYFDAKVSRTAYTLNEILLDLKNKNMLKGPILVNLGANGDCGEQCRIEIMKTCGENDVFWVNVTNDHKVHFNNKIQNFANKYDNLYVIDWNSNSKGHPEYFAADGIHLTQTGRSAYVKTIYDSIYQVYLEKIAQKKNEILKKHEEKLENNISFYGNGVLLNIFDYIKNDFLDDKFNINKDYNYEILKEDIENEINSNNLNHNIFLVFDKTLQLDVKEYLELIENYSNYNIYIVSFDEFITKEINKYNYENVTIVDFYKEIEKNREYIMIDNIHLTAKGNMALAEKIKSILHD